MRFSREAGSEFQRVVVGVFAAGGRDPKAGQHLPEYFRSAGLGAPDELGLTTEERSDALLAELRLVATRDDAWGRWPLLISAWKRKPADLR